MVWTPGFPMPYPDENQVGGGSEVGSAPDDGPYVLTEALAGLPNGTLIGAIILPPDDLANRPPAASVVPGTLYFASDVGELTRSTGVAWEDYSATGGGGGLSSEQIQDLVDNLLVEGANIDIAYDDDLNTLTISVESLTTGDITDFATEVAEIARDTLGTALVGDPGITITPSDVGDTITISFTDAMATQSELDAVSDAIPTTEEIQDIMGAMVSGGTETGIAVSYDDINARLDFVAEVTQAEVDLKANAANPVFTGTVTVPDNALAIADTSGLQAALDAKAVDADVVHDTGNETVAGVKTFTSDPIIPDEAYGAGWDGVLEPATKNAIYDKIETVVAGGVTDGDKGDITVSSGGTVWTIDEDFATQTELDDHLSDTDDAHAASAISILDTGGFYTGNEVEAALAEVMDLAETVATDLAAHDADENAHAPAFDLFATGLLQHSPDFLHDFFHVYEEFLGPNITSQQIGQYGWTLVLAATGAATIPASENGGPGYFSLNVPATSDTAEIHLDPFLMTGSPVYDMEWRIRQSSASTNNIARWGLATASTATPSGGAWFETGATNYLFKTRAASGTAQSTDTGIAVDTTWNTFRIVSDGSSAITAFVNGVEISAPHTTRSTADICTLRMGHRRSSSSGTAQLRCDYVWAKIASARGDE